MQLIPSWEADSRAATQEILCLYARLKFITAFMYINTVHIIQIYEEVKYCEYYRRDDDVRLQQNQDMEHSHS
jgi:hypothetical protein